MPERTVWKDPNGTLQLVRFEPSLFHLFPKGCSMLHDSLSAYPRYLYRLTKGYHVYVLRDGADTIGHAVLQHGPLGRYPFVEAGALLLGPYYIDAARRQNGYATTLLLHALQDCKASFRAMYACILLDNTASIKTVEKIGFIRHGYLDRRGARKKLLTEAPGGCGVWRIALTDTTE